MHSIRRLVINLDFEQCLRGKDYPRKQLSPHESLLPIHCKQSSLRLKLKTVEGLKVQ